MIFFELFYTFFFIGMFTIGGGYAMLSLIQHQVVVVHGWISAEAFTDMGSADVDVDAEFAKLQHEDAVNVQLAALKAELGL